MHLEYFLSNDIQSVSAHSKDNHGVCVRRREGCKGLSGGLVPCELPHIRGGKPPLNLPLALSFPMRASTKFPPCH